MYVLWYDLHRLIICFFLSFLQKKERQRHCFSHRLCTYVVEKKSTYTEMLSFYHALGLEKSESSSPNQV